MKYVWEEKDLRSDKDSPTFLGCIVEYTGTTASNRYSVLGYHGHGPHRRYTLTHLDDGCITTYLELPDMVNYLNENKYAPVMDMRRVKIK